MKSLQDLIQICTANLGVSHKKFATQMIIEGYDFARSESKWIPVGERLPEPNKLVWTFSADGKDSYGQMIRHGYWEVLRDGMEWTEVTHWMPLPKLPKVKSEVGK